MKQITKTRIVRIGNSRGIRIPKAVIDQLHLSDEVELVVENDHFEVRAGKKPRTGWAEAFKDMAKHGDDKLVDVPTATTWDEEEWEW